MRNVSGLKLKKNSREELLPDFSAEFPYLASRAELDKYPEATVPWHWHKSLELFYMENGCLEYTTPNGSWIFPEGSGGLVNSNILHTSRVLQPERGNVQLLHLFEPSLISGECGSRMEKKYVMPLLSSRNLEVLPLYPEDEEQAEVLGLIRRAFEISDGEWGYEFRLREMLAGIWLRLYKIAEPSLENRKREDYSSRQLKQMMLYAQENCGRQIAVEELADAVHISKRAVFRLFRENLHMTPVEYIHSCRLQLACRMLLESDEQITQIAGKCGFGSSSYFGRVFRERFGCSPLDYRKRWHDRDII